MAYLLKKDNYYCYLNANGKVCKTQSLKQARHFSKEEADAILQRATKKLAGYELLDLDAGETTQEAAPKIETVNKKTANKKAANKKAADRKAASKNTASKVKRKNFSPEDRVAVYNRYEGRCGICGRFVPFDEFTIDHIVPLSKGGTNAGKNLQCACKTCNALKHDSLSEDFMLQLEEIVLHQMKTNYDETLWKKINAIRKRRRKARLRKTIQKFRQKLSGRASF